MENNLRFVLQFLKFSKSITQQLTSKKLSVDEVQYLFESVNSRRKGYLDLADVYSLVGDVSEHQLFIIFKALDISKQGHITLNDFKLALSTTHNSLLSINDPSSIINKFHILIKAVLKYDYEIKKWKKQMNFEPQVLKSLFKLIKTKLDSNELTLSNLISLMASTCQKLGNYWWNQQLEQQLRRLFYNFRGSILQNDFLNVFALIQTPDDYLVTNKNNSRQQNQTIKKFITSAQFQTENTFRPTQISQKKSSKYQSNQLKDQLFQYRKQQYPNKQWRQNKQIRQWRTSKSYLQPQEVNQSKKCPNSNQRMPKKQYSHFSNNQLHEMNKIDKIYYNKRSNSGIKQSHKDLQMNKNISVEQRREQLRKNSIERKHMMHDFLERRHQHHQKNELNRQMINHFKTISSNGDKFSHNLLKKYPILQREKLNLQYMDQIKDVNKRTENYNNCPPPTTPKFKTDYFMRQQMIQKSNLEPQLGQFHKVQRNYPQENYSSPKNYYNMNDKLNTMLNKNLDQTTSQPLKNYRDNGLYLCPHHKTIVNHKENILKKAQEEANRKIQEIQRKARIKVLERKSSATAFRWLK